MVADMNLLGSVGDLYCFSNTLSMLVYEGYSDTVSVNAQKVRHISMHFNLQ